MNGNLTFYAYVLFTYGISFWILFEKYAQEGMFITFALHLVKSKSYLILLFNLAVTTYVLMSKFLLWLFFTKVRTSELAGVVDKLKMKIFTMFILFMTARPSIDLHKLLIIMHIYFIIFVNMLAFNRAAYLIKAESENRKAQLKMFIFLFSLFFINHFSYLIVTNPLTIAGIELLSLNFNRNSINLNYSMGDLLIYCIFSCEIIYIQLKLLVKFLKLSIDITELCKGKSWEYTKFSFSIINFLRYIVKATVEIKFCYIITLTGILPIFIFIDVFYSIFNLFKQFIKIYDYIKLKRLITKLQDFKLDKTTDSNANNCICLEEVEFGKKLPCGHVFHLHCIK